MDAKQSDELLAAYWSSGDLESLRPLWDEYRPKLIERLRLNFPTCDPEVIASDAWGAAVLLDQKLSRLKAAMLRNFGLATEVGKHNHCADVIGTVLGDEPMPLRVIRKRYAEGVGLKLQDVAEWVIRRGLDVLEKQGRVIVERPGNHRGKYLYSRVKPAGDAAEARAA